MSKHKEEGTFTSLNANPQPGMSEVLYCYSSTLPFDLTELRAMTCAGTSPPSPQGSQTDQLCFAGAPESELCMFSSPGHAFWGDTFRLLHYPSDGWNPPSCGCAQPRWHSRQKGTASASCIRTCIAKQPRSVWDLQLYSAHSWYQYRPIQSCRKSCIC